MRVVRSVEELKDWRSSIGRDVGRDVGHVAFVPTMGALHAGHVSLIHEARRLASSVVVSIFVNPTQFAPHEDLSKYPRPIDADLRQCEEAGVDAVFAPDVETIYPKDRVAVQLAVPELAASWEGSRRPAHFAGVCLVVAKLFNMVRPDFACFGEKDFQQLAVIRAMTKGLDFDVNIIGCPIVREPDGLAMSSRNVFLTPAQRTRARSISRALFSARDIARNSAVGPRQLEEYARAKIDTLETTTESQEREVEVKIDYLSIVNIDTLEVASDLSQPRQMITTVRVGKTYLLDNVRLG